MIGVADISRAVALLLENSGFFVVALDMREGYPKPACSVDVFPSSATKESPYMEENVYGVEIRYEPKEETQAALIRAAEKLKPVILYTPLEIQGRSIDTDQVEFDRDGSVLVVDFEYIVMQNPHENEETEEQMEILEWSEENGITGNYH